MDRRGERANNLIRRIEIINNAGILIRTVLSAYQKNHKNKSTSSTQIKKSENAPQTDYYREGEEGEGQVSQLFLRAQQ